MEISKVGRGKCIIIDDKPYRVKDIKSVVVSRHSHTRTKVELEDIFTGEKIIKNMSPHDQVRELEIPRKRGQFIARLDDGVQVMDLFTYAVFDAGIDRELLEELKEGDEIIFVEYNNTARVIGKKTG